MAFGSDYSLVTGRSAIGICSDASGDKSSVTITRGERDERTYSLLRTDRGIYVRCNDVLDLIDRLSVSNKPRKTELKFDFFPAPPVYLL